MTDAEVLGRLEQAFADRRRVDAVIARLAGEVADRSRPSLGVDGLARRYGATNPGALVASVGLVSHADGRRYCRVGEATAIRTTLGGEPLPPSYPVLARAVDAGTVSVEAAQLIVAYLDAAAPRAVVEDLEAAEQELVSFATVAVPEDVRTLAHRWRDALDVDGVEPREDALVAARALKKVLLPNGLTRFTADLDPLSAAYLTTAIDAEVTAALRKVRFVDPAAPPDTGPVTGTTEDPLEVETRTIPQIAADVLIDLVRHGLTCVETTPALAAATVVVRIDHHDLLDDLRAHGAARIDDTDQLITAGTARKLAAEGEILPLILGAESQPLDLGRATRLFTRGQKLALADGDGGCAAPQCGRPPTHTEAHHLKWWTKDAGPTDVANGILLCTRHHHLIHQNRWTVHVSNGVPWFVPPPEIDPTRTPRRGGRPPRPERSRRT